MEHIDDIRKSALKTALHDYHNKCKEIREGTTRYHICDILCERAERFFKGCVVYNYASFTHGKITINLVKPFNLSRDVNIFLDENSTLIDILGKSEMTASDCPDYACMDYRWDRFAIDVFYGNGACKRVKVSSVQRVITEDKYEIQCE